jgi:hypothetical protein
MSSDELNKLAGDFVNRMYETKFVMTDKRHLVSNLVMVLSQHSRSWSTEYWAGILTELMCISDDAWPDNPMEIYRMVTRYTDADSDSDEWPDWASKTDWDVSDW